ncbi:virulence factor [Pseudooceanicola sp. MF1-13]|uniref:virulence factor n=1 Tax=Pseudooceanicola sp. MF1-13 TaxID=3379095 RepID=UPI0038929227
MATTDITLVCWRDIPAQVIVGKGRKAAKQVLPERFEQAIDRAAMKVGASDTDAYLAEWRKTSLPPAEGDPSEIAAREIARLDAEYDQERLKALIANDGWA